MFHVVLKAMLNGDNVNTIWLVFLWISEQAQQSISSLADLQEKEEIAAS